MSPSASTRRRPGGPGHASGVAWPFAPHKTGGVVIDGVVRLTVDGVRGALSYAPLQFGPGGSFKADDFPAPLTPLTASDTGTLYAAEAVHPGACIAVINEDGLESVNIFLVPPSTTAMIVAHRVEAEVALLARAAVRIGRVSADS